MKKLESMLQYCYRKIKGENMNLYEAIFVRKSVRSYTNDVLSPQLLDKIREHFHELTGLFGGIATSMSILDNRKGQQKLLSLFSVKAPYYMAFYSEEAPRYLMNTGYLMEQMVLYLCSQGIGTCFIGSRRVRKELQSKDGRKLVGLVAFGKSKGPCTRKQAEANRLALDEICVFKEIPRQWGEAAAGGSEAGALQYEQPALAFCSL